MQTFNQDVDLISIVAPAYNEEEGLDEFVRRIDAVMTGNDLDYEIVFVNDGSTDRTLSVMQGLQAHNANITVINLSRNFGKEIAMTAGIAHALGDALVVIDTDLQDPPEVIPELVEGWRSGYDVVYGQRSERAGRILAEEEDCELVLSAGQAHRAGRHPGEYGRFQADQPACRPGPAAIPERHQFMKGLYAWIGFRQKAVLYKRHARFAGTTKWNYWKLWNLAIEGITSFTIVPLKLATYLGFAMALFAFGFGLFIVGKAIFFGEDVRGYPTMMALMLLLGGVQLIVLGLIGEYLGRNL